jgi:eukaryotic-like serine/threonine-protein kinase
MSSGGTGPLGSEAASLESPDRDALHNLCLADPLWRERYDGWIELGRGATAIVVRTHSRALGEDVALKVFPAPLSQDARRFQEEVRNAQRLASPYIVRIYSPFPRGSLAWIEMELVDGVNLRQELERRQGRGFSTAETLALGQAVAEALATAHRAGVVHRDVKPANLLLPRSGSPVAKLGDFGVSRLTGSASLTRTGLLVGTPQFVAPEVVEGRQNGTASDVYSFGHCLYLMLSGGRFPFHLEDSASPLNWMRAHTDQAPIPVRAHNPDVPPALGELVEAMLAKDPARRPSAQDVAATLAALRAGAAPPGRKAARGSRLGIAAGLALVLAAILTWRGRVPDRPEAQPTTTPAATPIPPTPRAAPSPEPVPTGAPSSPAPPSVAPDPPLPVSVSLRGELLGLRNTGGEPLRPLEIVLVFATPPSRSIARHPEGLASGEELFLALESFEPAPPAGSRPDAIEIAAGDRRRRFPVR